MKGVELPGDNVDHAAQLRDVMADVRADRDEIKRLTALVEAFKAVPLYIEEPNWSAPEDERDLIQICIGCGYPGKGYHDGDPTCPVYVVEKILSSPSNAPNQE